jgi:hypothetical protein
LCRRGVLRSIDQALMITFEPAERDQTAPQEALPDDCTIAEITDRGSRVPIKIGGS